MPHSRKSVAVVIAQHWKRQKEGRQLHAELFKYCFNRKLELIWHLWVSNTADRLLLFAPERAGKLSSPIRNKWVRSKET